MLLRCTLTRKPVPESQVCLYDTLDSTMPCVQHAYFHAPPFCCCAAQLPTTAVYVSTMVLLASLAGAIAHDFDLKDRGIPKLSEAKQTPSRSYATDVGDKATGTLLATFHATCKRTGCAARAKLLLCHGTNGASSCNLVTVCPPVGGLLSSSCKPLSLSFAANMPHCQLQLEPVAKSLRCK